MSSRKWVLYIGCLTPILLLSAACAENEAKEATNWQGVCVDVDGDSFGFQCASGADCDDQNSQIHEGCGRCDKPAEGCECAPSTQPVTCDEPLSLSGAGSLICKEGTRFCRDGVWSACEGIRSFEAAPRAGALSVIRQSLISADAATSCGPCTPDCYELEDPISPGTMDGGSPWPESGIAYTNNGGITLGGSTSGDASVPTSDELTQVPPCDVAVDADCDGIPDALDPFPSEKPFESDHSTIFMDLAPGQSKSNVFDLRFFLKTADIYFLIDMTGSMDGERDKLIESLKVGNFLNDPSTPVDESASVECADRDFNGSPDDFLKTRGVAGNIACLIRNSGFGAGWFREIPFSAADSYGIRYSYPNFEPFEHRLDITDDVDALDSALTMFDTRGNQNWAEDATVGLHAVATGGPLYLGWDRPGVPKRTCPTGHFGYPCFRNDAMPIVVLMTDAPMMNGPVPAQGDLGSEGSSNTGRQPVNYQNDGLRYLSKSSDGVYHPVEGNENIASAYDVGAIDSSFKTYSGSTRGMAADYYPGNLPLTCAAGWPSNSTSAASPGYPDAVFKFKVTDPTKKLTISTRGTRHKPTLAIIPVTLPNSTGTVTDNHSVATARDIGLLTSAGAYLRGDTTGSQFDAGELSTAMLAECVRGDDIAYVGYDAWFKFTPSTDMANVRFAIDGSYEPILALFDAPPVVAESNVGSNDKTWTAGAALPTGNATTPGAINGLSHWLKSGSTSAGGIGGDYAEGLFTGAPGNCTQAKGNDAVLDFTVTGTTARTLRVETTGSTSLKSTASFDHVLGVFARPATAAGAFSTALACNTEGVGTRRAFLEGPLNPGTYSAVVKGDKNNDKGSYGLLISDTSARPIGCHAQANNDSFTANLKAGVTYYLAMRGQKVGRGAYAIQIGSGAAFGANALCAYNNATYSAKTDDPSYGLGAAEIVDRQFPVGEYYAIIKGRGDIATPVDADKGRGLYQITFGDSTLATNDQIASIPTWGNATSGVHKELVDRGIRVITVASTLSCAGCAGGAASANTALRQQGDLVSSATKATSTAGTALRFDIRNDGQGMGFAVVDSIARLSNNIAMDVSVRLVPQPDNPAKPFIFQSRAINTPGDSCTGPIDTNADGVVDTHTKCTPGAVPRFEVTFTNPAAPNNVPINPATGSNGGYNMRLELIADGKYVIDSTPVFIIPQEIVPDPPTFKYDPTGSYMQDIQAACTSTDRPDWKALAWSDSLPTGTSLQWSVCAGDSVAELDQCQAAGGWTSVANVLPGIACTNSSQCIDGYCASGTCHHVTAPANTCVSASDCGVNGVCIDKACVWTGNPISMMPSLARGLNGKSAMRMKITLNANPDRTEAPSVQDFRLQYVCRPGL
jgi:hypothetical protein